MEIVPVPSVKTQLCRQTQRTYIFMRIQRLEKANGQKIAELLAVVTACSCIGYSNEQTTFSDCFETMGQIYPSGRQMRFFTGMVLDICRCQQECSLGLAILNSVSLQDTNSKDSRAKILYSLVCLSQQSEEWQVINHQSV